MPGIKPSSATWKARVLVTVITLWPPPKTILAIKLWASKAAVRCHDLILHQSLLPEVKLDLPICLHAYQLGARCIKQSPSCLCLFFSLSLFWSVISWFFFINLTC